MNKRIDPKAALDATARHLRQALRNEVGISTSAEMRTTFSVDRDIHDALRLLAARHRCKLNDLVAIAVEDLWRDRVLCTAESAAPVFAAALARRRQARTRRRFRRSAGRLPTGPSGAPLLGSLSMHFCQPMHRTDLAALKFVRCLLEGDAFPSKAPRGERQREHTGSSPPPAYT
jgi:hypothetical protein